MRLRVLLIGLPFWFLLARNPNRTPFRRIIPVAFIAVMMVVLVVLGKLDIFVRRRSRPGFIDRLQQRSSVRDRLK